MTILRLMPILLAGLTLTDTAEAGRKRHSCVWVYCEPVYCQPVCSQPVYSQPVYSQPVYSQPCSLEVNTVSTSPCCSTCEVRTTTQEYSYTVSVPATTKSAPALDIASELTSINLRLGEIRRQLIGKKNPLDTKVEADTLKNEVDEINAKIPVTK